MNQDQTIDDLLAKYLADETDAQESDTVSEWIIASDEHKKTFDDTKFIWDNVATTKDFQSVDVDAAWAKLNISAKKETTHTTNATPVKKLNWLNNFLKIAAVLVVLFGLWYVAARQFTTPQNDVLTFTTTDSAVEKTLPDGTKILLSKNSTITFPAIFSGNTREINLVGEGFFDVHHDVTHPFIIHTQGTDVKVLGTSFNVSAYTAQVQVVVKTGKVQFSKNNHRVILEKGQKAEILANLDTIIKSEVADAPSVKINNLQSFDFDKKSLSEVVTMLSEKFNQPIMLGNAKIKNCKLTASFEQENLENIISVIAETFNLEVKNENNTIVLSGEGCE